MMNDKIKIGQDKIITFLSLFTGNLRNHGVFQPHTGKMFFEKGPAYSDHYEKHLYGKIGLGIVPITDEGKCSFAAIDIDCHGDEKLDLGPLSKALHRLKVPALLCRSKSGGAHVYVFFEEPEEALQVRPFMSKLAFLLEKPKAEIFPKQNDLRMEDGSLSDGSWINLPYFGIMGTERYCLFDGRRLKFSEFLEEAVERKTTLAKLILALNKNDEVEWGTKEPLNESHPDAPPCIQALLMGQVPEGCRNSALYSVVVYLRKAFPNKYRELARSFNDKCLVPPLPPEELERTIKSASRRDYYYKCNEEPLESLCDSATCVNCKYGIDGNDAYQVKKVVTPTVITPEDCSYDTEAIPGETFQVKVENKNGKSVTFGPLIRQNTDPVRWILRVNDIDLVMTTEQLNSYTRLNYLVQENLCLMLIPLKKGEWPKILSDLLDHALREEAPELARTSGVVQGHLDVFAVQSRAEDLEKDMSDDEVILRMAQRSPFIKQIGTEQCVCFKGTDFLEYLRFARFQMIAPDIWNVLKRIGVKRGRLSVQDTSYEILYIPVAKCNFPKRISPSNIDDEI